jgi:sugar phosphate isomerase/epimerase
MDGDSNGGDGPASLRPAVMSSSSDRDLSELILEVASVSNVSLFDLLILRDVDIRSIPGLLPPLPPKATFDPRTITQIMSNNKNVGPIADWIVDVFARCNTELAKRDAADPTKRGGEPAEIAALATFYPGITDRAREIRGILDCAPRPAPRSHASKAVRALANTVRLANTLKTKGLMRRAIVEIVCGTVLDQIDARDLDAARRLPDQYMQDDVLIFESSLESKLGVLLDRLLAVARLLKNEPEGWVVALELEPGPTYVVNDERAIAMVLDLLDRPKYAALRPHFGFNMDIAHMKIANVSPEYLESIGDYVVHAHICDHPRMHTRDQVVGVWDPVERFEGRFYPYLRVLENIRATRAREHGRAFSGAVALELEGCNRIAWIHQSLHSMRHCLDAIRHSGGRTAPRDEPVEAEL